MEHATVKVIDLWAAVNLMKSDKMKFVTVTISDDGNIDFSATTDLDDLETIVYDPVESIPENPYL